MLRCMLRLNGCCSACRLTLCAPPTSVSLSPSRPTAHSIACSVRILEECGIDSNVTAGTGAAAPSPSPAQPPVASSAGNSSSSTSSGVGGSGAIADVTLPPISSSSEGSSGSGSGSNGTLPDGRIALFLSIAQGPVPCYNYTPGQESNWTANPAGGLWGEWRLCAEGCESVVVGAPVVEAGVRSRLCQWDTLSMLQRATCLSTGCLSLLSCTC